jgi:hypothetical protein
VKKFVTSLGREVEEFKRQKERNLGVGHSGLSENVLWKRIVDEKCETNMP